MSIEDMCPDLATVIKRNGARTGPFRAVFSSKGVIIPDVKADIEEGDLIERTLPNGRVESHEVFHATLHRGPRGDRLSNWEVETRRPSPAAQTTIHVNNSRHVQIGDGNTQTTVRGIEGLVNIIRDSSVSKDEKRGLLSKLSDVLAHPAVVAVLGTTAGAIVQAAKE